jgi:hypothetical protein
MLPFFNVITCPLSKTTFCNKPDLNILFNNENIAIFVKMTLTLVQGQGEEIGHNLLHTFVRICLLIQNLKKSCRSVNLWRSYRHFNMSKILRFSIITPVKKGAREMILTFLDFFCRGLPTHKKSAS